MSEANRASLLHTVAELVDRQVTKDQVLRAMVDHIVEEVDAERGTLYLIDAITGDLCSRVAHLPEIKEIRLPLGKGIAGRVAQTGEPMNLRDVAADDHFYPGIDRVTGYTTRSMLTVPVRDEGGAIRGVLQVLNHKRGPFSEADQQRLAGLAEQVAQALARTSMRPCGDRRQGVLVDGPFNNIVGESPAMAELYRRILAAATTDATVLILGESGTGKTLIARAIHDNGERNDKPFVHVDCTALPAGLIESELLGHERGAFTGADRRAKGKFELAHGGTLLLDEVGDLPLSLQGKLLRFLQDRAFERLGGEETLCSDARVISATNTDLDAMVAEGRFRRDLYYRLRVVLLTVPPLRERGPRDIERLAEHFLDVHARRHRRPVTRISRAALERLAQHPWPGNVRELEHCIESAVVFAAGSVIEAEHLALPVARSSSPASGYPPGMPLAEVERQHIQRTLEICAGNRSRAAELLGIGRNTLLRKLREG